MSGKYRICVVGAGVVGLSAAVSIIENIPNVEVTIVADKFGEDTTSNVAGGIICPHALGDTPMEKIMKWTTSSRNEALRQYRSKEGGESGAIPISCYLVFTRDAVNTASEITDVADLMFGFRELSSEEMFSLFGCSYPLGYNFTTLLWDTRKYQPWLLKRFKARGGRIQSRHLKSLREIFAECDVIVNCSGMRAESLVPDDKMVPIRGQILRVKAPWINYMFVVNIGETYLIPGTDFVTVGGTHQVGNRDLSVSKEDRTNIWRSALSRMPNIEGAQIIADKVGLRPGRTEVRLEKEIINYDGREIPVVHNYGHGGAGVTLSWGCAEDTTDLVRDCIVKLQKHRISKL